MNALNFLALTDDQLLTEIKGLLYLFSHQEVIRHGLDRKAEEFKSQSVSEHIYNMMTLCQYFLPLEDPGNKLDKTRIAQLILWHDIEEIETGDIPKHHKTSEHETAASSAFAQTLEKIPNSLKEDVVAEIDTISQQIQSQLQADGRDATSIEQKLTVLQDAVNVAKTNTLYGGVLVDFDRFVDAIDVDQFDFDVYPAKLKEKIAQISTYKINADKTNHDSVPAAAKRLEEVYAALRQAEALQTNTTWEDPKTDRSAASADFINHAALAWNDLSIYQSHDDRWLFQQKSIEKELRRFHNSMLESVVADASLPKNTPLRVSPEWHVTKDGDRYFYDGEPLELKIDTDYRLAFDILYDCTDGKDGVCLYEDFEASLKKRRLKKYKRLCSRKVETRKGVREWAHTNLTEKGKGILSKVLKEDLITTRTGVGFSFNNKK